MSAVLVFEIEDRLELDSLRYLESILMEYNASAAFFVSQKALELLHDLERFTWLKHDGFYIGAKVVTTISTSELGKQTINWSKTHELCRRVGSKAVLVPKDVQFTFPDEVYGEFAVLKPDFYAFPEHLHLYRAFNVISIPPYRFKELESGLERLKEDCDFISIWQYFEESEGDDWTLASAFQVKMNLANRLKSLSE